MKGFALFVKIILLAKMETEWEGLHQLNEEWYCSSVCVREPWSKPAAPSCVGTEFSWKLWKLLMVFNWFKLFSASLCQFLQFQKY